MNIKMIYGTRKCILTNIKILIFSVFIVLPELSSGVTTIHYDKPSDLKISSSDIKTEKLPRRLLANLTLAERQKRLLPYINFYLSQQVGQPYNEEIVLNNQRYRLVAAPAKVTTYQPLHNKYSELIGATYQPDKIYETEQILRHNKAKFTPFLESNALPGPFTPMVRSQPQKNKINYVPLEDIGKIPNFSAIYDKLSQLKLQQIALHGHVSQQHTKQNPAQYIIRKKPHVNFIPVQEIQDQTSYGPIESPKTYIHTYTPTSIEVTNNGNTKYEFQDYDDVQVPLKINANNQKQIGVTVTQIPIRIAQISTPKHIPEQISIIEEPVRFIPQQNISPSLSKQPETRYVVHEQKQYHNQNHKQYLQEVVPTLKPPFILIPQKTVQQYHYAEAPKQESIKVTKPIIILPPTTVQNKPFVMEQIVTQTYQPITNNHQISQVATPVPEIPQIATPVPEISQIVTPTPEIPTENPNSLNNILRRLQESNALPQTLTPENIDNSIKTLVRILTSLKNEQQLTARPIIVADEESNYAEDSNEAGVNLGDSQNGFPPGTVVQTFPAHTPEGGTPGKPGVDYPALSNIPQTSFNCKTQRYKGFFADPDTHCQVWHYCDLNGGQASFLCPNGTIFSQVALTCDWWFNVKCSTTTQLYVLNERLYKYIIPLTPKFPEDYSGPLVDRYLALKFKEMEEKMKNEKKKKGKEEKQDDADELQLAGEKLMEQSTAATSAENEK